MLRRGWKKYIVCMKHHFKIWHAVLMLKVMTRGINGSEAESSKGQLFEFVCERGVASCVLIGRLSIQTDFWLRTSFLSRLFARSSQLVFIRCHRNQTLRFTTSALWAGGQRLVWGEKTKCICTCFLNSQRSAMRSSCSAEQSALMQKDKCS